MTIFKVSLWESRAISVNSLHYIDRVYTNRVSEILNNLSSQKWYCQLATMKIMGLGDDKQINNILKRYAKDQINNYS